MAVQAKLAPPSCYDQLTPVKTRYLLIAGSSVELIEVTCFFFKLTADQVLVFDWIVGSCQVDLLKTGQDFLEAA